MVTLAKKLHFSLIRPQVMFSKNMLLYPCVYLHLLIQEGRFLCFFRVMWVVFHPIAPQFSSDRIMTYCTFTSFSQHLQNLFWGWFVHFRLMNGLPQTQNPSAAWLIQHWTFSCCLQLHIFVRTDECGTFRMNQVCVSPMKSANVLLIFCLTFP